MYTPRQILRGITMPRIAAREINRFIHTRGGRRYHHPKSKNVLDREWDCLIILDACRYDVFKDVANLPGNLSSVYSRGSATYDFICANFSNRKEYDTVYVSANAWFLKLQDDISAEVHEFINLQDKDLDIEWANKELATPSPQAVTKAAKMAHDENPNKRLIVHYLQPHHPFIGPTGKKHLDHDSTSLLEVVEAADISDKILRKAYRENLEIVLPEVEELLTSIPGRKVVTADHGEMLGDRHDYIPIQDYGHFEGILNESTIKVPWLVYESDERPEIIAERPKRKSVDVSEVNEQLENLGYKI
ncbi:MULTISPECIES: hypothetical protein [Halorussus]|uniref:hypothetical protein n=1 Tax=Halorussus TaxID=1070314 RepID=UPI000E217619|nr:MULTISPECIES: hypothetical protein [Halorussus]NHN60122.1 hypothetical protein [Halorussus sp. JP-T4]